VDIEKDPNPNADATDASAPKPYQPLTDREKVDLTVSRLVRPAALVSVGIGAGIMQAEGWPSQWGGGAKGYARRLGTIYGIEAAHQSLLLAGSVFTHEDPRPLRSQRHGFFPRAADALKYAMLSRRDDGSLGFAYARTVSDLGTAAVARAVYPGSGPMTAGSMGRIALFYAGGQELFGVVREFSPDITHAVHLDGVARWLHFGK
jgi:hypothetical protein